MVVDDPDATVDDATTWSGDGTGSHAVDRELERALVRAALFDRHAAPRIGRFCVGERLGAGASSVVYAAWDELLARRVAVKIFVAESSATRHQVQREARALAQLSHRHVVAVFDVGAWNHHAFIAMELIAGTTLARWQAAPGRTTAALLDAYLQAGRGLEAAHRAGLVHRDFKPANAMVADDGRVVVTDFGLVSAAAAEAPGASSTTYSGTADARSLIGTPAYVAPEQRRGAAPHPSADIYSFSLALCEALLGWHPMRQATQVWQRALGHKVPPRLHAAICAGLAEDPAARGGSIAALLAALEPQPQPPPRGPASTRVIERRWVRMTMWAASALIASLVVRCVGGHREGGAAPRAEHIVFQAPALSEVVQRVDAVNALRAADEAPAGELRALLLGPLPTELACAWPAPIVAAALGDDHAVARDDAGRVYACALATGAVSLVATGARCALPAAQRTIGVLDAANQVQVFRETDGGWRRLPAMPAPPFRKTTDPITGCPFTVIVDDHQTQVVTATRSLAHDHAGAIVASPSGGELRIVDRRGPTVLTTLELLVGQSIARVEISRDGTRAVLAYINRPSIYWWGAGSTEWHEEPLRFGDTSLQQVHLSPSGERLLVVDLFGKLEVRTLGGGFAWWLSSASIKDAVFGDDDTVVALDGEHRVWRWDLARQRSGIAAVHARQVWSIAADAAVIASGGEDGSVRVVDRATRRQRFMRTTGEEIYKVMLDGDRVVAVGNGGLRAWRLGDGAPVPLADGRGLRIWDARPVTDADGSRYYLTGALAEGAVYAWYGDRRELLYTASRTARVDDMALSPDGRTVAIGNSDGQIVIVDAATRAIVAASPRRAGRATRQVAFDARTGAIVTAGDDGIVRTWSPSDAAPRREIRIGEGAIYSLDVEDGRAVAASQNAVALVDLASGQVRRHRGHHATVLVARFRPGGAWFVTGDAAGQVCLWRVDDDACHTWLRGHRAGVFGAAFADDGALFTTSQDGVVRWWRPTYDEPPATLRAELARH